MTLGVFLDAFPWTVAAEETGPMLERLRGEVGVSGLSIWAASPPVTQWRTTGLSPTLARSSGGLHYVPSTRAFASVAFNPPMSEWARSDGRFERAVDACRRRSFDVRVIVSAATIGQAATRYPEFASQNAFGLWSGTSICLSSVEVQASLCAMIADAVSQFAPSAIVVSDLASLWWEAFAPDVRFGKTLGAGGRRLLGMCFCRSCRARATDAGIDVDDAQARCRTLIDRLSDGVIPSAALATPYLSEIPALAAYARLKGELLSGFLRSLVEEAAVPILLIQDEPGAGPVDLEGVNLALPAGLISNLDPASEVEATRTREARRQELRISAEVTTQPLAQELVGTFSRAAAAGYSGFVVDNLGILSGVSCTSLKQAIRFARRSTGS